MLMILYILYVLPIASPFPIPPMFTGVGFELGGVRHEETIEFPHGNEPTTLTKGILSQQVPARIVGTIVKEEYKNVRFLYVPKYNTKLYYYYVY